MRFKEKIGIFVAAVVLTLAGFSFIVAPSVDMLQIGKQTGYRIVANYLVEVQAVAPHS